MSMLSIILLILVLLHIVTILLTACKEREVPELALFWSLAVVIVPIVGYLVYTFIGSTQKAHRLPKSRRMHEAEKNYVGQLGHLGEKEQHANPIFAKESQLCSMATLNANVGGNYYSGNEVTLLTQGEAFFSALYQEIANAKDYIYIEFYIIRSKNETGKKLISLLTKKAAEGVKVVVLYDSLGCLQTKQKDFQPIIDAGGVVLRYLPRLCMNLYHSNYRLHRKIVVIDGTIAFMGGMNIADDYLGTDPKLTPWRDTFIRVTGSSVSAFEIRFLSDLNYIRINTPAHKRALIPKIGEERSKKQMKAKTDGSAGMQVIWDGPDRRSKPVLVSVLKMIGSAKSYLYIQTPYFVPGKEIKRALRIAVQSGVDVRLMIPGTPDHKTVYNLTQANARILQKYGVKVYLYKGFLHAKSLVLDDEASCIGTANFDFVSFHYNYEVNAIIYDQPFAALCRETFLKDMKDCSGLSTEKPHGLKYSFYRLLASLL